MTQTTAPYGSWRSPISSDLIAGGSVRLSQVALRDGSLYWLESRPTEGGRYALVRREPDGSIEDVTPSDMNVRTRVHEYGGASYSVTGAAVFFSNYVDQQLYRQDRGDDPIAIVPEQPETASHRYADARLTPDGRTVVCIRERHEGEHDVVNELVAIPATGGGEPRIIAGGHDFVAYPRVSPDGRQLAWITWDHPRMPWDGTELWLADLAGDGAVSNERLVAGGPAESIFQPEWSLDGALHFVSDRTGWWNLYRLDGDDALPLAPMNAEFGGPQWGLDAATYACLSDGRIASVITVRGMDRLCVVTPWEGVTATLELPLSSIGHIAGDGGNRVALLASGPELISSVLLVDVDSGEHEIVRRSNQAEIEPGYLSRAQPIEFPTTDRRKAHAFYYAPHNRDAAPPEDEMPPLIVFSHGGPTGATSAGLNLSIQFWTSRGFAVVDVNYGDSTGYGRAYRERLRGRWGVVDIDDCVNASRFLVLHGLADPNRLAIRGGSAGGYTTLAALCFTDVFSAGASYYGIADLEALARDTHKFESRYLDSMVGPWPEQAELYRDRSPIHHTDGLSCPMIVLQGLDDKVVPPSQAEMMVAALKEKGMPHAYLPFEGEQHGFRRAENIKRSLDAELYFYSRVFGFDTADEIEPVEIVNL
ncbi:MAG TPA: S9 family peptidase [Thermomicrobiales bacterium]|nr:S9 family peptidase [Thermomicrobiales bacterium]